MFHVPYEIALKVSLSENFDEYKSPSLLTSLKQSRDIRRQLGPETQTSKHGAALSVQAVEGQAVYSV